MLARMCKVSAGPQFLAEPIPFMPLLSRTLPRGANKTINKIRIYVFRCKPGESFIPFLLRPLSHASNVLPAVKSMRAGLLNGCRPPGVENVKTGFMSYKSFKNYLTGCLTETKAPGQRRGSFFAMLFR